MARKRFLSPDIWSDAAFRKLPRNERLLFIGLITLADDEGRVQASPAYLRGQIFPDDRDLTDDDVKQMRDRIVRRNRNVRLYKVARIHYVFFKNWSRYQAPSHPTPSRIPPPPISTNGHNPREALVNDSGNPRDLGMGVGRGMGSGKGKGLDPPPPPPPVGAASNSLSEFLRIHEENFGDVTPSIERQLRKLCKEYPLEWFEDAVREACVANVLHLGYPTKVLARWSTEGKDD